MKIDSTTTSIAPSLYARLACACDCAYGISATNGSYTPPAIYDDGVDWTTPPTAIFAPSKTSSAGPQINACLVGVNQDGIIVSFRGTLPLAWTVASLDDWWQDIVDSTPVAKPPLPGKVHEGFWDALDTIFLKIATTIQALQAANSGVSIYITGHSKGGPLATICAARLALELKTSIVAKEVVTFASPYPGDAKFVSGYPSQIPVTRFENYLDIVPLLPPTNTFFNLIYKILPASVSAEFCKYFPHLCTALTHAAVWNYTPLGTLKYVTESGDLVGESNSAALVDYRIIQILLEIFGVNTVAATIENLASQTKAKPSDTGLTRIGAAHCIACKSNQPKHYCAGGYMTGAGGNSICPTSTTAD